jgi:hypothetical protein
MLNDNRTPTERFIDATLAVLTLVCFIWVYSIIN